MITDNGGARVCRHASEGCLDPEHDGEHICRPQSAMVQIKICTCKIYHPQSPLASSDLTLRLCRNAEKRLSSCGLGDEITRLDCLTGYPPFTAVLATFSSV
jgi:hypothetical protein